MLREFEPGDRVAARLEISTGGLLRGRTAGDRRDGRRRLVAFAGGIGRRELELDRGESVVEAVRRELSGD